MTEGEPTKKRDVKRDRKEFEKLEKTDTMVKQRDFFEVVSTNT